MPLDSKVKKRLMDRCRREWHWSKEKKEAVKLAETEEGYRCAQCEGIFPRKKVQVDHIIPVVDPATGWDGWDSFIDRMFCPVHSLRVLCKECHHGVTQDQNLTRYEHRHD